MWDKGWDKLFDKQKWGKYPPEELVRFIARNFSKVPNRKDIKVLEIGCGPGANLWYLLREGFTAYGFDGSQVALDQAKERLAKEGFAPELKKGDAMQLPYASNFFDCVIDVECIYANTKEDSKKILSEVYRVLKPKGRLFSKTFMTGTHEGALHSDYGVIRYTSEDEIKDLYDGFSGLEYDYLVRSDKNRKHEVKEWLIQCQK